MGHYSAVICKRANGIPAGLEWLARLGEYRQFSLNRLRSSAAVGTSLKSSAKNWLWILERYLERDFRKCFLWLRRFLLGDRSVIADRLVNLGG